MLLNKGMAMKLMLIDAPPVDRAPHLVRFDAWCVHGWIDGLGGSKCPLFCAAGDAEQGGLRILD